MLVLSRKKEQAIRIGSDIVVRICHIDGRHVVIGIEAPKCVQVLRDELVRKPKEDTPNDE